MRRPADGPDERLVLPWWRRVPSELAGACGDLGTFIPHVIGAITVAGLAPAGEPIGFGAFLISSGLFYGLPTAVQPMKAISAVLVTGQVGPAEIAAAGILLGAMLLILAGLQLEPVLRLDTAGAMAHGHGDAAHQSRNGPAVRICGRDGAKHDRAHCRRTAPHQGQSKSFVRMTA